MNQPRRSYSHLELILSEAYYYIAMKIVEHLDARSLTNCMTASKKCFRFIWTHQSPLEIVLTKHGFEKDLEWIWQTPEKVIFKEPLSKIVSLVYQLVDFDEKVSKPLKMDQFHECIRLMPVSSLVPNPYSIVREFCSRMLIDSLVSSFISIELLSLIHLNVNAASTKEAKMQNQSNAKLTNDVDIDRIILHFVEFFSSIKPEDTEYSVWNMNCCHSMYEMKICLETISFSSSFWKSKYCFKHTDLQCMKANLEELRYTIPWGSYLSWAVSQDHKEIVMFTLKNTFGRATMYNNLNFWCSPRSDSLHGDLDFWNDKRIREYLEIFMEYYLDDFDLKKHSHLLRNFVIAKDHELTLRTLDFIAWKHFGVWQYGMRMPKPENLVEHKQETIELYELIGREVKTAERQVEDLVECGINRTIDEALNYISTYNSMDEPD